jgi:hypothetical protein
MDIGLRICFATFCISLVFFVVCYSYGIRGIESFIGINLIGMVASGFLTFGGGRKWLS